MRLSLLLSHRRNKLARYHVARLKTCLISLCLVGATLSGCSSISDQALSLVGRQAPESRLMLLSGEHIALRSLVGKNVVLLFWATWCPHSRSGIEEFEALAHKYSDRPEIQFYAVSIDKNESYEELQNRIRLQGLGSMTHVFSGNDVQDEAFLAFHGERLPYAVFIDAQGVVRFTGLGVGGLSSYLSGWRDAS
jgi:thiol-disulfide isomerase/thioredoxin